MNVEPSVSIIVPVKNEAANLREVLPALPSVHEVIVVDGHSVDDSAAVAVEVLPACRVITQTRRGKGNALACGFAAATGDIVVMFDADGSADPSEIADFVQCLVDGADFAKGTRFRHGGGSSDITPVRRCGNAGLNATANRLFGTTYSDLCYGYNAFWRRIVPVLELPDVEAEARDGDMIWGDGFEIETVINCRIAVAGLSIVEVGSFEKPRIHGESNLRTVKDGIRVLRTLVAERRRAVMRESQRAVAVDVAVETAVDSVDSVIAAVEVPRQGAALRPVTTDTTVESLLKVEVEPFHAR